MTNISDILNTIDIFDKFNFIHNIVTVWRRLTQTVVCQY